MSDEHGLEYEVDAMALAPRPRVEGEAITKERVREILVTTTDEDVAQLAVEWRALTAEVERLRSVEADNDILSNASVRTGRALLEARAEVERLRGEKAEAMALADEALALGRLSDDQWGTEESEQYDRVATRLAALALPTNAPEAKCPDCEGNGFYVTDVTVNECCGHGTPSGECCGSPVAGVEQEQVACERCQATGKVTTITEGTGNE